MHGPSFSSFHFLSFSIFFPKLTIFTFGHGLQDVENDCAQLRDNESKTDRKIPYLRFPHVLFLIGEHEITKPKKILASRNPEKRHKNKHKKT